MDQGSGELALESRVNRLALERQDAEDALMHPIAVARGG